MTRIDNLGTRETSTVTGSTVKRLFAATGNAHERAAVQICNHDPVFSVWAKLVAAGAALPTIAAAEHDYKIPPGDTALIPAGDSVDVCVLASSGGSATAAYSALEVK